MGQHDALTGGQVARKEEIRAERGLDLVLLRERVKRIRAREHLERIEPALAGQSASVFFAEKRLGAEPYALVGHELRGFFVHEMAVFDYTERRPPARDGSQPADRRGGRYTYS